MGVLNSFRFLPPLKVTKSTHEFVTEGRSILHSQKYHFHFICSCLTFPLRRIADEPRGNEANLQRGQLAKYCRIISHHHSTEMLNPITLPAARGGPHTQLSRATSLNTLLLPGLSALLHWFYLKEVFQGKKNNCRLVFTGAAQSCSTKYLLIHSQTELATGKWFKPQWIRGIIYDLFPYAVQAFIVYSASDALFIYW